MIWFEVMKITTVKSDASQFQNFHVNIYKLYALFSTIYHTGWAVVTSFVLMDVCRMWRMAYFSFGSIE
jgi:hypothetical protein